MNPPGRMFAAYDSQRGREVGMSEDHLDKETSVSVDLTETGATAKAKSRFVAAVDRLGGNLAELLNVPIERRVSRERAIIAAEKQIIEASAKYGIDRMQIDPEFAQRAVEKHLGQVLTKQANKDAVLVQTIEDMRHDPVSEFESRDGPDELDSQFVSRFERMAEEASTEQLREKWGRVLSAEIRKPGTFSAKVLRVVDELDAQTAQLFETLCESRLSNVLPKCLVGKLTFHQTAALTSAGLLVEPGDTGGQIRSFRSATNSNGESVWMINLGDEYALAFAEDTEIPAGALFNFNDPTMVVVLDNDKHPALPIYVLTDAGAAVAEILPNHRLTAFSKLAEKVKSYLPSAEIFELEFDPLVDQYRIRKN